VDWLVECDIRFRQFDPNTLFLTVSLLDRFLEKRKVQHSELQLLGATGTRRWWRGGA
jgi:hypothetical protein